MGKSKGGPRIKQVGPSRAQKAMMQAASSNPMEDLMIPPDQMVNLPPPPDRTLKLFWPLRKFLYL